MTATTTISVEEFRARARAWLAANVERKPKGRWPRPPRCVGCEVTMKRWPSSGLSRSDCSKVALPASPGRGSVARG